MNHIKNQIKELKNFLILWGSQSLSTLGSSMTSYALLIWVYQQKNSTTSVALLAVCTYLPSIFLSFLAGTFVDRHNKKKIMLFCDSIAAVGTILVFLLLSMGKLQVLHIYCINVLISVMNAFQIPANTVVISEIVPKKYYMKVSGLNSISSSAVGILTPTLATALLTFLGIDSIFIIDLVTFIIAFTSLLFLVHIPSSLIASKQTKEHPSFVHDCKEGFRFLLNHTAILQLVLFFTAINLVAFIGAAGINTTVTAMILSRIPDGQFVLGTFCAAVGMGTLVGGVIVTFIKPPKKRIAVIFISCAVSFFICDLSLAFFRNPIIWIVANFIGNVPLAFLSSNQAVIMRTCVPIEMQGRVFSARDTMQYCTIPLGYLLGGVLADNIFEPLMKGNSSIKYFFATIVGEGKGSGIAVMFIFTGIFGTLISMCGLLSKDMKTLDVDTSS